MAHKMKGSEFYGKGNQSPAKQYNYGKNSASPYEAGHTDDDSFEKSMGKIADRNLKEEEKKQEEPRRLGTRIGTPHEGFCTESALCPRNNKKRR